MNKHYFNCLDNNLLTLDYSFWLIIGHLGSTYVENLNMSNWISFSFKNDDFFKFFENILQANHKTFFFYFHQLFKNLGFKYPLTWDAKIK
jgi:hypothetical protein